MITFFIQLLIPMGLMFYRFPRRKKFVLRLVLGGIVFCGLSALWYSPSAIPFIPEPVQYYPYYLTGYVFAFCYALLCFDMRVSDVLFFSVAAFLIQNFSHHVFELIMRIAGVPVHEEYGKIGYLLILGLIYTVAYALIFILFMRRYRAEDLAGLPRSSTLVIAALFLLLMIVLGVYVRHIRSDLLGIYPVAIGYEIYSVTLVLLILALQFGLFNNVRLRSSNEELESRLEHEAKYYEIARANMEQINIKVHDLKHQIAALGRISDPALRKESLDELREAADIYGSIARTGNAALDSILTEKGMYCTANGITLSVIADGALLDSFKHTDIYALFGNALDNAIESVLKEPPDRRLIGLRVQERGGMICVHVENYFSGTLRYSDGLPRTTKADKSSHGFGMKSIRYIVSKYKGNLTVSAANDRFSLDMLFPMS